MPYVRRGLIALNVALFLDMLGAPIDQQNKAVLRCAVVSAQLSGISPPIQSVGQTRRCSPP